MSRKYRYRKCPSCGARARYDKATYNVQMPDGSVIAVPNIDSIICKKCGTMTIDKIEDRDNMIELVEEIQKGIQERNKEFLEEQIKKDDVPTDDKD